MKKLIFVLTLLLIGSSVSLKAQQNLKDLPANTVMKPYKLEIGYYTTTVLVFPAQVLVGDRGFNEIIATEERNLSNVLKIKAARKNFNPTNLHVFTADGRIYPFEISYSDHPSSFTFDLINLGQMDSESLKDPGIIFSGDKISDLRLQRELNRIKTANSFFSKSVHKYEMKLRLRSIYVSGNRMYFGLELNNKSNLTYDLDFIRTYIQDEQKVKRSSFQETEIIPIYKDSLRAVLGGTKSELLIAVPKFTLSRNKRFRIELFEKDGGRDLFLEIKNHQLLRTRNL
jgi:conjugative transposon TraN protein